MGGSGSNAFSNGNFVDRANTSIGIIENLLANVNQDAWYEKNIAAR